jgi:hypothetical protein
VADEARHSKSRALHCGVSGASEQTRKTAGVRSDAFSLPRVCCCQAWDCACPPLRERQADRRWIISEVKAKWDVNSNIPSPQDAGLPEGDSYGQVINEHGFIPFRRQSRFVLAVDLGQSIDPTAIAVIERIVEPKIPREIGGDLFERGGPPREDWLAGCVAFGAAADPFDPLVRSAQPYLPGLLPEGARQGRK